MEEWSNRSKPRGQTMFKLNMGIQIKENYP